MYMSLKQLKELKNLGHEIGSHSTSHESYANQSRASIKKGIINSFKYLKKNSLVDKNQSTFCYPSGGYSKIAVEELRKQNIKFGLTTKVGNCLAGKDDNLLLPRFDANDFLKLF